MKKMKKLLAMLCGVLSVLSLASAFAGEDNNNKNNDNKVRWESIVGVITAPNVDNPVGSIHSGTFPWSAQSGTASVDLTTGAVAFQVNGLVINGASPSGTTGPITLVKGTLVCNAGTGSEAVFDTPKTVLNAHGDAQFTGHLGQVSASCGSPVFLIRIVSPAGASGLWIATGANPSSLDTL